MTEHPIEGLMKTALENIREMIDVNTILGDPVETPGGDVILTVSKVSFGFVSGGTEFETADNAETQGEMPFGGGAGGGVSISPMAFLVVGKEGVKLIPVNEQAHLLDKMITEVPRALEKIQQMLRKSDRENKDNYGREEFPI